MSERRRPRTLALIIALALTTFALMPLAAAQDEDLGEEAGDRDVDPATGDELEDEALDDDQGPEDPVQPEEGAEPQPLPVPLRETPVFPVDGDSGTGRIIVLSWPVQENATAYDVYVNADVDVDDEGLLSVWVPLDAEPEVVPEEDIVRLVIRDPPEPADGRDTISYAIVAVNEDGEVVSQGRVAVDPDFPFFPLRDPYQDEVEEVEPAVAAGTAVGLLALAAVAVGAVAYIVLRNRD